MQRAGHADSRRQATECSSVTFYQIIFGILFLAAFREFLRSVNDVNFAHICESTTLMLLVFSDVIYTSHVVEEKGRPYTLLMKFTDLGSFVLLSLAIFALDPTQHNLFQVQAGPRLQKFNWIAIFWLLIVLYWSLLIVWNYFGKMYAALPGKWSWVQPPLILLFLVMLAVATLWPASAFAILWRVWTVIVTALYLGFYKPYVLNKMS